MFKLHSEAMRRWVMVLLLAGCAAGSYAGRLEKAFAALGEYDYFKARTLLLKETGKHPAAAWYGLSVITGRADNPFFQLDSSYAAVRRSMAAYALLDAKGRGKAAKLGVDSAAIGSQLNHIAGIAWKQVSDLDRLEAYQRFIDAYAGSNLVDQAMDRRDELAFQEAKKANTSVAYEAFLHQYPDAKETFSARTRLQEAIYREATPTGAIAEYEAFIVDHPSNTHVRDAQDMLLKLNTPHKTPEEYAAFIRRYPGNPNVSDAWRSMYDIYTRELTVANITRFLKEHPDYPFIGELMNDYKVASLVLYPIRQGGLWGFIDNSGVERIKAEFDYAEPFIHGQAQVGLSGRNGSVNKMGSPVIPIVYDDVMDYGEGMATVELNGMQGAVDRNGKLTVPLAFDEVGEFDHGMAAASKGDRYGYINTAGKEVIPFAYDGAMRFHNGLAVVVLGNRSGVVDNKGEWVVPCQYDWVEGFMAMPFSRVRRGGYMGIINRFGDEVLAVEHDHVGPFKDGLALVMDKGKCGYVGPGGTWVIPQRYEGNALSINMGDFRNGLARVLSGGKWGMVDTLGNWVIQPQYADIGVLEGGLIPVKRKNKWGYIKRSFANVVEAKYDQAWELHEGYGRVEAGALFGLIDSTGTEVIKPRYTALGDQGTGVLAPSGKVLVPLEYDSVVPVDKGMVKVTSGARFGYVRTSDGNFLWKEDGFGEASAD